MKSPPIPPSVSIRSDTKQYNPGNPSSGRRPCVLPKYFTKKEMQSHPAPDSQSYIKAIEIKHLGWLRAGIWVTLCNVGTAPKVINKIISL